MNETRIGSEEVVWRNLVRQGEAIANQAKKRWNSSTGIHPIILAWPSETITADDGKEIDGIVALSVPNHVTVRRALFDLAQRTYPIAVVVVQVVDNFLTVILESHYGTRSWKFRIERRGDVLGLGGEEVKDDEVVFGVFRHPSPT